MTKLTTAAAAVLTLLSLAGCRNPERRDYDSVRDRSEREHGSLDRQQVPSDSR